MQRTALYIKSMVGLELSSLLCNIVRVGVWWRGGHFAVLGKKFPLIVFNNQIKVS